MKLLIDEFYKYNSINIRNSFNYLNLTVSKTSRPWGHPIILSYVGHMNNFPVGGHYVIARDTVELSYIPPYKSMLTV